MIIFKAHNGYLKRVAHFRTYLPCYRVCQPRIEYLTHQQVLNVIVRLRYFDISSVIDLIDQIDLYRLRRLCTWSEYAGKSTSEIEPPRPLPSIGLSHLPVRKRFELLSRFNTEVYGKSRTKPRMQSEIRRVTEAWNTPARLYPFLLCDMCTRRRRIPSVSK